MILALFRLVRTEINTDILHRVRVVHQRALRGHIARGAKELGLVSSQGHRPSCFGFRAMEGSEMVVLNLASGDKGNAC
jgi:hypothetical protein